MAKLSKRARACQEKVDPQKAYPVEEAVTLLKELSTAKFNETVFKNFRNQTTCSAHFKAFQQDNCVDVTFQWNPYEV